MGYNNVGVDKVIDNQTGKLRGRRSDEYPCPIHGHYTVHEVRPGGVRWQADDGVEYYARVRQCKELDPNGAQCTHRVTNITILDCDFDNLIKLRNAARTLTDIYHEMCHDSTTESKLSTIQSAIVCEFPRAAGLRSD